MVETSFKYLISSAICVGKLRLFDLLGYFWLPKNRICPINHLKKIRNNDELCKVKTI